MTLPQPRAGRPGDRRPALPRPEAGQRRARAGHLAGRVPPVPRRGDEAPRGQAQADPGRARDRGAARPPPGRRPGLDRRRPHVDYCEYYLRDQPAGPINPPPLVNGHDLARHGLRPGPQTKVHLDRSARPSSNGSSTARRKPWSGSTASSPPGRGRGSGRPALNAVGVGDLDRGPGIARDEAEGERQDLAGQDFGIDPASTCRPGHPPSMSR